MPVLGVAGAAQAVDGDAGQGGPAVATGGDAADRAQDLGHAVGRPRPRLGDDERPIGGEQAVDREQAERGRAVDDDEVVADALERDLEPVLGADGVVGQLGLAGGEAGRAGDDARAVGPGPAVGELASRTGPRAVGPSPVDRSRGRASTVVAGSQTPSPLVALAWGSRSTTSTLAARCGAAAASPSATVVLPTPPFWFTTATIGIAPR